MQRRHRLPVRELVFIESLRRHGFRLRKNFHRTKRRYGYVVLASDREDASGVDFFVKMPRENEIYEVQVTQRGNRLYRQFDKSFMETESELAEQELREIELKLLAESEAHLESKREVCYINNIALVMVQDFSGEKTNPDLAWRDVKALRYGIEILKHRLS